MSGIGRWRGPGDESAVVLRAPAEAEFDEAFDWYDRQRPGLGAAFAAAVQRAFNSIAASPLAHAVVIGDVGKAVVRRFPYCVYYVAAPRPRTGPLKLPCRCRRAVVQSVSDRQDRKTGMSTISIRRLNEALSPTSAIISDLVAVWRAAREDRLRFLTDLHSADEDRAYMCNEVLSQNQVWVADVDDAVAGFIAFGRGWVNQLYVAPEFQGRGVGTELLAMAMRCNPVLELWVFEENVPAIRFYERRGFSAVERTDGATNEAKRPDLRMRWEALGG